MEKRKLIQIFIENGSMYGLDNMGQLWHRYKTYPTNIYGDWMKVPVPFPPPETK